MDIQKHAKSASSINHCFRDGGSNTDDLTNEDDTQNEDTSEGEDGDNVETNVNIYIKTSENSKDIMEGKLSWKWVEVQYSALKSAKKFKGQVINTTDDQITVKFLKVSFGKYIWPEEDDIKLTYM